MRSAAIAVISMLSADAYARMSADSDPNPINDPLAGAVVAKTDEVDGTLGDDEFSNAIVEARKPLPIAPVPEAPQGPGKYQLEYNLKGQRIVETHRTLRQGLAGMRRLNALGIHPKATTNADMQPTQVATA